MRPCGSPPRNNSVLSWPATGKGSTTGSAPTPASAGPIARRAMPSGVTRACSPPPATPPGCRRWPATLAGMRSCCGLPGATTPLWPRSGLLSASSPIRTCLTCRLWWSWRSTGTPYPSATSPSRPACPPCGHGSAVSIMPRPWPAPSPTRPTRCRRSPSWPAQPPRPATRTGRPGWPPRPRPWPAPSPTRRPGAGARRAGQRGRPGRRPGPRVPAGHRGRGPGPHHHQPRRPGAGAHRAGQRGRPGRRPGPRRGPGPHHHQPLRPGAGAHRAGQRGRPGRRPGPGVPAGHRGRGPGPHHHQPRRPGAGAHRAGQRSRPGRRPGPRPAPTGAGAQCGVPPLVRRGGVTFLSVSHQRCRGRVRKRIQDKGVMIYSPGPGC